jgi:hypothetical protein
MSEHPELEGGDWADNYPETPPMSERDKLIEQRNDALIEVAQLREALRELREALVAELPEGERSLKWKNVLERSRRALGDTPDE